MSKPVKKLFGYVPDKKHNKRFVSSLPIQHIPKRMVKAIQEKDVLLWKAKNVVQPTWRRGAQGTGDCVSWGCALGCTCLLWNMAAEGLIEFLAEVDPTAIYGGCRVEIHGGPQMGRDEPGAAGSWGADWLKKYGVLLCLDYSKETGNPEHDLRRYDVDRATDWGYDGCGGRLDKDKLDTVARQYPVKEVTQVRNADEVEAALAHRCVVTFASMVGFEGERDQDGIIDPNGQWPHQMACLGVKRLKGERLFRIFNSWNDSAEGPDPGIDDEAVSACSWWVRDRAVNQITNEQDSFAFSDVEGLTQPPYDWDDDLIV